MKKPLFSVIIPAHNRAGLLRMALKSLQQQSFTDYEAFIIDDGSEDDTPAVFKEFASNTSWHFHRFDKNRRQAYCRNFAVKQSQGAFITFLDSDDVWLSERLQRFAELIKNNPRAGFIFSNGYIEQDGIIVSEFFDENRKIPAGRLEPYMAISNYWLPYVTTNVAIAAGAFKDSGFREDMSHLEDMEFYVRVLRSYEAASIPEPLSVYRIHKPAKNPKSLTLQWEKGIEDFLTALQTASPPAEIAALLKGYVFYNQATIYLKNGDGENARKYFARIPSQGLRIKALSLISYAPQGIIALARSAFKRLRVLKYTMSRSKTYSEVESYMKSLL